MTKRSYWLSVIAIAAVSVAIGGLFGWFVRGGWTPEWVSAAGVWVGAAGTICAVVAALGIAIRDGRQARASRELDLADRRQRESAQAASVLVQIRGQGGLAFELTNYSDMPIRNLYLEAVSVAWKQETKDNGAPVYRPVEWSMKTTIPSNIRATPMLSAGESHTFYVELDTGMSFLQAHRAIAAYEVEVHLTDIAGRRWRNVNGKVALIREASALDGS
ncbi:MULTISPECIES: hypothetical protein [Actinomycetes]|uniref:hypothetical protein n=1 Tax=Actinomycetes TaxID=1760 RepID=UPI0012DFACB7|nr:MULTISPECIES: hypothetical protein [Actinomycetes]